MSQLQAKLMTKDERYQIPTVPLGIPGSASPDDLNGLVNRFLLGLYGHDVEDSEPKEVEGRTLIEFDFLVNGELLRSALGDHVEQKGLSTESVIEIEFVVKRAPPEPSFSIPHEDWVSAVCCCQDKILTGCYDCVTRLWDNAGNRMADFASHEAAIKDVAWISCDDVSAIFVSASQDETLRVWQYNFDSNSTNCICVCEGHMQSVESVAVNAKSKIFCSGSWDGTIKVWSSELNSGNVDNVEFPKPKRFKSAKKKKSSLTGTKKGPLSTLLGHGQAVSSVTWVDNETVCSSGWDHCIRLWDLESGVNTTTLARYSD
jgi:ribosome biogenesis protein YTM1